jgi:hypothetical protein
MPEIILMKYGSKNHMNSFLENGQICMNSMSYFHEIEGDHLRHDPYEGLVSIKQMKNGILKILNPETGEHEEVATITKATIRESNSNIEYLNLFCMFAVDIEGHSSLRFSEYVDKRVWKDFGDSLVIISDLDEFISRIKIAAEGKGIHVKFGLVHYKDFDTYEGDIGPFIKSHKYSYQNEARFVAFNEKSERLFLNIGPIKDIAKMLDASDTPKLLVSDKND